MKNDLFYALTCLCFSIMIGGAVYEHLNVVPKWSAAPPLSLSMFHGDFGLKPEAFWILIHPVNILLFIITLVLHWKTARRKTVLSIFALYVVVLVITRMYFVPELISIITTPFSPAADPGLTQRASLWETLSLVRMGALLLMAVGLFLGLTKPAHRLTHANGGTTKREPTRKEPAIQFTKS
jgi:hypothetical protein